MTTRLRNEIKKAIDAVQIEHELIGKLHPEKAEEYLTYAINNIIKDILNSNGFSNFTVQSATTNTAEFFKIIIYFDNGFETISPTCSFDYVGRTKLVNWVSGLF